MNIFIKITTKTHRMPSFKQQFQQDKEKLRELYLRQNLKGEEIAKLYGCSKPTACQYLRELFGKKPVARKTMFFDDEEKLKELYIGKGLSLREIGQIYKINRETTRTYLQELFSDTSHSPAQRRILGNEQEIIKHYKEGKSTRHIADKVGVGHRTIQLFLKTHEVKLRKKWEGSIKWSEWVRQDKAGREQRRIHEFYNHTCEKCGLIQDPWSENYNMKIHHNWGQQVTAHLLCENCHKKETYVENHAELKWGEYVQASPSRGTQALKRRVHEYHDHTCQKCGLKGNYLNENYEMHIHHIWENPIIETLLCPERHNKVHK